jgi:hypothetical protein
VLKQTPREHGDHEEVHAHYATTRSPSAASITIRSSFLQPPLTDEKGVATVLKFLATQSEFRNAKNAKAAISSTTASLSRLQREGYPRALQ